MFQAALAEIQYLVVGDVIILEVLGNRVPQIAVVGAKEAAMLHLLELSNQVLEAALAVQFMPLPVALLLVLILILFLAQQQVGPVVVLVLQRGDLVLLE
jgi:hypothetical protein